MLFLQLMLRHHQGGAPMAGYAAQHAETPQVRNLAEKMLTFALGRGLENYDRAAVDEICRQTAAANYKFSAMVLAIANSKPFQMRSGEVAAARAAVPTGGAEGRRTSPARSQPAVRIVQGAKP